MAVMTPEEEPDDFAVKGALAEATDLLAEVREQFGWVTEHDDLQKRIGEFLASRGR